ncbi:MAG: hypothetical protein LBM93_01455 [Oscillospiraceae bacterium]|jgi:DNA-directed RNA polymerase specialized sigma subunit|nr:hypothetical protein [Oscillospiraceae bacterium]
MNNFKTHTDWTANKNSKAIVYSFTDGTKIEVTLADFLKDCNTDEEIKRKTDDFHRHKISSDEMFCREDLDNAENDRNTLPLFEWSDKLTTKTLEEEIFAEIEKGEREFYKRRIAMLREKLPILMDKLTSVQYRRLQMYKIEGLPLRDIAKIEGVSFQAIKQSIDYIEKKIKKILAND